MLTATGVVQVKPREGSAPIVEDGHQNSGFETVAHRVFEHPGQPEATFDRIKLHVAAVADLIMMSAFVAFARTGNPNHARLPEWAPYDGQTRISMLMQSQPETASDWRGPGREAVDDLVIDPFNRAALWRYDEA